MVRLSEFIDDLHMKVARLYGYVFYMPATFTPQEIFLLLISVRGTQYGRERITSIDNPNDTIGNQTHNHPAYSAVSQQTVPPHTPLTGSTECVVERY